MRPRGRLSGGHEVIRSTLCRYAYHRSSWLVAGKADPAPPHRLYPHPDGPFSLEQLRKQVTSFEKVKITNNESDNSGQVRRIFNSV